MRKRMLVAEVLRKAIQADLARVMVVGLRRNGKLYVTGSEVMEEHLKDFQKFEALMRKVEEARAALNLEVVGNEG